MSTARRREKVGVPVTPCCAAAALIESAHPAWARPDTQVENSGDAVAPAAPASRTSWSSLQFRVRLA